MARTNPRIEQLEREVKFLREDARRIVAPPGDFPCTGCGDGSCEVKRPSGMHTNGGCRCEERELRRALRWYKQHARNLENELKALRDREEAQFHSDVQASELD